MVTTFLPHRNRDVKYERHPKQKRKFKDERKVVLIYVYEIKLCQGIFSPL